MATTETLIHETAIIDPSAEIGEGVEVGAYSIIGRDVVIGSGTVVAHHVVIDPYTTIGRDCQISSGAILGGNPQDQKFKGEKSFLIIGDRNILREHVTMHRATGEGNVTRIGDDNMLMAYCHVGHNCTLGSNITMANTVGISGHVEVESRVVIGGMVGVHQFVRIGKLAMVGGYSKVTQDVPPFMMVDGRPMKVYDLNVIGLRRSGVTANVRSGLRQAYKLLYRSNLNHSQAIETIENEVEPSPERDYLLEFVRSIKVGYGGRQMDLR
ncbi:MAG: acyl-ACP--UDP-N-acetylglucosamine O-acyltransferase [Armatimonadota bacterium]